MKQNIRTLFPQEADQFYAELTTRNRHFVDPETQSRIRNLKVFVAGCGSAGGACLEPLARLGVTHFRIADNGDYELANMNRQRAFVDSIGVNKATFHEGVLKRINPFVDVEAFTDGITHSNISPLVEWSDIVFDCVDVTTPDAIQLKLRLHELAKAKGKPVFSMLDVGYRQWGIGFDYRKPYVQPLNGRLYRARGHRHPIKVLLEMFPFEAYPPHALQLVVDLLNNTNMSASQLGCAADLLASVVPPAIVRFAKTGEIVKGWDIDLAPMAYSFKERFTHWWKAPLLRRQIRKWMRSQDSFRGATSSAELTKEAA